MGSPIDTRGIEDGTEIYEQVIGEEIEQSSIYDSVLFACFDKAYPAIVLTPICDIVSRRAEYLKVAQIIPAQLVYEEFLESKGVTELEMSGVQALGRKRALGLKKEFTEQFMKNRVYRYHFLPRLRDILADSFVDFQIVQTVHAENLKGPKKLALLKSPWRECLPSRYAAYCLRIGTRPYSDKFLGTVHDSISLLKY